MDEVDIDMQTQSLILKFADWFLHSMMKRKIKEKLNMAFTQSLEQSSEMARKAIAQAQLADYVILKQYQDSEIQRCVVAAG
ncbi:MAG TPA: DUF4403 family protein [Geobacteraceae bacterium]|nr:DUF4403 family protein [Geobacteraceae bacterium]